MLAAYYFFLEALFFFDAACVSADAATLLTIFEELGLLSNFEAFDATDREVFSLGMAYLSSCLRIVQCVYVL